MQPPFNGGLWRFQSRSNNSIPSSSEQTIRPISYKFKLRTPDYVTYKPIFSASCDLFPQSSGRFKKGHLQVN